jgi:hypothetical protein
MRGITDMAIVFPNNTLQEVGVGKISSPGNLIQVVEVPITASLSSANWATQNVLATATIVPTSVTSKILIYTNIHFRMDAGSGNWSLGYFWFYHDTTATQLMRSGWNGTWRNTISSWQKQFLHSPSSTATQTYSLRCGNYPSGTTYYNNSGQNGHDGLSYIRLMEFAA